MKFLAQQHIHDSHISTHIQTLISPYILPLLLTLFVLLGYRTTLDGLTGLNLDDTSIDMVGGALVLNNSTELSLNSTEWAPFDDLQDDLANREKELYESIVASAINNTLLEYETWRNNTITALENSLESVINRYETQLLYVSKITALIQDLNTTIIDELVEKNSQLSTIESEIADSLSVGGSIDVSQLTINITGISEDFGSVLNGLQFDNDTNLLSLNKSMDSITLEIESIFETALEKLEEYDYEIDVSSSSSSSSSKISISKDSTSTNSSNISNGNGSSSSTSLDKDYNSLMSTMGSLKVTLITLGCFIVVTYVLISILNHYHFQYSSQLRKDSYAQSMESSFLTIDSNDSISDVEKNIKDLEQPMGEDNFNAIHYRLRIPSVTLITDYLSKLTGNWYLTYWRVEYLTLRLPLIMMVMVSVGVILLGVMKTNNGSTTGDITLSYLEESTNYTESTILDEYTLQFPSFQLNQLDVDSVVVDWNDFITELQNNVTASLKDLFDDNNITGILLIDADFAAVPPLTLNFTTTSSSTQQITLPNISLSSTTLLTVTSESSSVSISSIWSIFIAKSIQIVKSAVIQTCVIALCAIGGLTVFVLLVGVVYSLLM